MSKTITKAILTLFLLCFTGLIVRAQSVQISGIVRDNATNAPIPGVGITVKGKTAGTATDNSGRYAFTTTEKAWL